ncbi:MAG TPA: hypothetical protein VEI97_04865, partial [bacterium]|nr:hypothetical protein [bacterium]
LIALAMRAMAYHLDAGLRDPGDVDRVARAQAFLQTQRALALVAGLLAVTLWAFQRFDPRQLGFAEGLSLSWAQQHLAIFGFIGGYITEHRRLRAERLARGRVLLPGSPLPL